MGEIDEDTVEKAMQLEGNEFIGLGPGQISSDCEMAMCLLNSANDDPQLVNLNKFIIYFRKWFDSKPSVIGVTTKKAL